MMADPTSNFRLSWNMADDGVITVYARTPDGKVFDLADIWRRPMMKKLGIELTDARLIQIIIADRIVGEWNNENENIAGGFATPAPPEASIAPVPDGASVEWQCPIKAPGCQRNCGSYCCGN